MTRSLAASFLASLAVAAPAAAQLPARVAFELEACEGAVDAARVAELLRVELTADGIEEVGPVATDASQELPSLARVRVSADPCAPDTARFVVRIDDRATHKSVERAILLEDLVADARARALALSIAELLRASWAELAVVDAPPHPEVPPRVLEAVVVRFRAEQPARLGRPSPESTIEVVDAPVTVPRSAWLAAEASALVRSFAGARSAVVGGRLGASLALGALAVRLDIELARGESLDRLGRIGLLFAGGAVALGVASDVGGLRVESSVRASAGYGRASGEPYDADTISGDGAAPVVLLGAEVRLVVPVVQALRAIAAVEVGGALLGVDALADGLPVAGLSGAMLAGSVGLGWAFE